MTMYVYVPFDVRMFLFNAGRVRKACTRILRSFCDMARGVYNEDCLELVWGVARLQCQLKQVPSGLLLKSFGSFQELGALLGSFYIKDHNILDFVLEPPIYGNSHLESA